MLAPIALFSEATPSEDNSLFTAKATGGIGGGMLDVIDCSGIVLHTYARHWVAARAYFRKVDHLVDCSIVSSRQSNRRRVGDASVMDPAIELCRQLDGVDILHAQSELPTRVQAAARQLKETAKSFATVVELRKAVP